MSAAPLVAALLREALPAAAVLDLTLPAGHMLPWWPGARPGLADPAATGVPEAALLRRFRQGRDGHPVLGVDPLRDAALLAGAPGALGEGRAPLLVLDASPPPGLETLLAAGAMVLHRGDSEVLPPLAGPPRGCVTLLCGGRSRVERWDLLPAAGAVPALLDRLEAAARGLAGRCGGDWQIAGHLVPPHLASLELVAAGAPPPPLRLPAPALAHDLPGLAAGDLLPLDGVRRLRLLLGALPARPLRLALHLRGGGPDAMPALFLDGLRLAGQDLRMQGGAWLVEAEALPGGALAAILGLAWAEPAPPGLALQAVELLP